MSRYRVSMDIGGTFTDVVAYDEETRHLRAPASRRPRRTTSREGVFAALEHGRRLARRDRLHGARHDAGPQRLPAAPRRAVLLLATRGAGDVYHIARGNRHAPLRRPLPQADAARAAQRHRRDRRPARTTPARSSSRSTRTPSAPRRAARGTRASAPSPSPSSSRYVNPAHELRAEEILREELDDVAVSLSHRVAREWREYERTSSAVVDAYTAPVVRRYLERLGVRAAATAAWPCRCT